MAGNARLQFGQQVYDYFLSKGLQPHQAAAIAGNMAWEGGGRIDLINPNDNLRNSPRSPHSFGVAQWNDRLPGLIAYARSQGKDIPEGDLRDVNYLRSIAPQLDTQTQLGYVWQEMQGPEGRAFRNISGAQDISGATAGAIGYHRPAGWTMANPTAGHGYSNRLALANQILAQGPGAPPAPQPPDGMDARTYNAPQAPNSPAQPPGSPPAYSPGSVAESPPAAQNGLLGAIFGGDPLRQAQSAVAGLFGIPSPSEKPAAATQAPAQPQEDWQRALAQLSGTAADDRQAAEERRAAEDALQLSPMGVPQAPRRQDFRQMISNARQPVRLGITRA